MAEIVILKQAILLEKSWRVRNYAGELGCRIGEFQWFVHKESSRNEL